ncbi:coiled-coil domain-containing protein 138-like [Liolophura sinensis]|uniref:coiled-coil domain-containing protein 138-like n=1 Tax=Liolophura sinensis TaxID=3198878 RepID=UPI0031581FC6
MYFLDPEEAQSDIDSTVTPIESVPAGQKQYGYLLESDDLPSLDLQVDRHREKQRQKLKHVQIGATTYSSSSELSDKSDDEAVPTLTRAEIRDIYKELQVISNKLKEENKILREREQAVKERERLATISQNSIQTITDFEIRQRWRETGEKHRKEISDLEQQLREKGKENKRLKENFETLKLANDTLRKELQTLQIQHEKLEKQSISLQSRLTNLQRRQEVSQRQPQTQHLSNPGSAPSTGYPDDKQGKQQKQKDGQCAKASKPKVGSGVYEILGVLLDWVADLHLRQVVTEQPTQPLESLPASTLIHSKCLKILPCLGEVIREFPGSHNRIYLPCLQFIYWSLLNLEQSKTPQTGLTSTLRRLGEELYKPRVVRFQEEDKTVPVTTPVSPGRGDRGDKSRETYFFKSTDLHTRFLSSLIILKTLSQADVLAHVFDCLRNDLKSNTCKDLFLYYQATPIILPYLRPVHKTFLSSAVDIYLQMSMESAFLQHFLDSCSNEHWFRTVAMALRSPNLDTQVLEKISIILQKLSKMKPNKKYFEVYTIISVIQELLRGAANDSAFLSMNLKSILFNLGVQTKTAGAR